ncbi:hypothetical protein IMX26_16190 [Clostridium sp. 'deep sea']|uniref:hypothetical protein n=1 Tax=Clostridium sp. 'deep sea' TaxID=2779445 RepID=UPI001896A341|nr:hypothetical protein [Clostridium sp. 'deep sea']QOR34979.1 hypothetical protein IMX26_16190 [Clostridium sp. 'deep sea']
MPNKKHSCIIILVFIAILIGCRTAKINFLDNSVTGKIICSTENNDIFTLKYKTQYFLDIHTDIKVVDNSNKKTILEFKKEGELVKSQFITITNTSTLKSFIYDDIIVYKINDNNFKAVLLSSFNNKNTNFNTSPQLITIAAELVKTHKWQYLYACAEFLVKANHLPTIELLTRIADGVVTAEELLVNSESNIKTKEIREYAQQILKLG